MLDLSRLSCVGEALRDAMVTYKSNVALIEADRHRENARFTYIEVKREAERIGALLQEEGVLASDRVAILMSNQARWAMSALGVFWSGAVLVPLDYKLTSKEQLALLSHARPQVLITEYSIWRALHELAPDALAKVRVLVTEAPAEADLPGASHWQRPATATFVHAERERSDVACIVYSSGTGGTPKGCMLTHDNYLEQAQVLGRMYPMQEDELYFSILPTNHAIDFMCGLILPLLFGAAIVHQRTLRPEFLAPTMKRYGITHLALVPRILKALRERIEAQLAELPEWQRTAVHALTELNDLATLREPRPWLSRKLLKPIHDRFGGRLKLMFVGGAFVEPELAEFFYRLGLPVVIGYGLTEACTVLTLNDGKPLRSDTVGRPVPGVELTLRDENDEGVGEVYVRGRTVMSGYFEAPELTVDAFVDGWLRTGDLGALDASGHLRLLGRAKNMIVTEGGKNIYPEDIEAAFDAIACEELCVFAVGYLWPRLGERDESLTVVVRPKPDVTQSELVSALRAANQRLAPWKRVSTYVLYTDEFPRTASTKVKRAVLAAALRASSFVTQPLVQL